MSRILAREKAMALIYQMDINNTNASEIFKNFNENLEEDLREDEKEYIENCLHGVEQNIKQIDRYIEKYLKGWRINRVAKVDLAILRLAVYEMLKRNDVPAVVAVNEAIELAKRFGGDESSAFINGVLGNLIKEIGQDAKDSRN